MAILGKYRTATWSALGAVALVLIEKALDTDLRRPLYVAVAVLVMVVIGDLLLVLHQRLQRAPGHTLPVRPDEPAKVPKPRLLVERVWVDKRSLIRVNASGPDGEIYAANVWFRNDPTMNHPDASAASVLAHITFFHAGQSVLEVSPGRWGDTDQPTLRHAERPFSSTIDLNAVPFRIGERHELNVAIKYSHESQCYAFSNVTYGHPDWKPPAYLLPEARYHIRVRLVGPFVDEEFHFGLENLGLDQGMELTSTDGRHT
jgi:hypothetical protein